MEDEIQDATEVLVACAMVVLLFAMLVVSIAVGFIFGAGYGFLILFVCLLALAVLFVMAARESIRKGRAGREG